MVLENLENMQSVFTLAVLGSSLVSPTPLRIVCFAVDLVGEMWLSHALEPSREVDDPHPSLFLLLTSCATWANKHFIVLLYKIYHIVTVSSEILYYLLRF